MSAKKKNLIINIVFVVILIIPFAGMGGLYFWYKSNLDAIDNASFLLVDKDAMTLKQIDYKGRELRSYGISCGKNLGDKQKKGDFKTPEGVFHICDIQDASTWTHDFKDGKGKIEGAYGPYFIRLKTPGHSGIGIHGTHKPESIGTRDTEGCIRLLNENVAELVKHVNIGMAVVITPSSDDATMDRFLEAEKKKTEAEVKKKRENEEKKRREAEAKQARQAAEQLTEEPAAPVVPPES